jgi:signal transduction histidine kinase
VTRGTVRVRLTALYSSLFLITATILLVVVNLLLRNMLQQRVTQIWYSPTTSPDPAANVPPPPGMMIRRTQAGRAANDLRDAVLDFQWVVSGITILVLTLVSVAVGWWLAGRVLSPLHQITATARRLSLSNLNERIALTGPRDELKELADTFDAMLDRLERSAESQRQFVANASHELRTPLAIQRAAIEIGLDEPTPERLASVRQDLLTANRRTERLIDGLLTLAQGDRGLDIREPVRLDVVVREVAAEAPTEDTAVTLDVEPVVVIGDPVLLGRLVANLLDNAVRYNRPGGSVWVKLTATGTLSVCNTGTAVPEDRIGELFEPFRRLQQSRTRSADGAGLGLSIVSSIAQAHGAFGHAHPNRDGGLTVTVQFAALTSASGGRAGSRPNPGRPAVSLR